MNNTNNTQDNNPAEDLSNSLMDALDDSIKQEPTGFFSIHDIENLEGNDDRIDDILNLAKGSNTSQEILNIIKSNMPDYITSEDESK